MEELWGVGGGSNLLAKSKGGLQALLGYLRDWFRLGISYDVIGLVLALVFFYCNFHLNVIGLLSHCSGSEYIRNQSHLISWVCWKPIAGPPSCSMM